MAATPPPSAIILVGASGFAGRNFADALGGSVERLIAVTAETLDVPGCDQTVTLDGLADIGPLPPDTVVIHVGAYRYDPERFELAQSDILLHNADLNARIYQFCAEREIREVRLASSVAVYPAELEVMDDTVSVDLNRPPHTGEAFYAWSKRWAEIMAGLYRDRFGINTVTFRLSNPYGPHDSVNPRKAHVAPAFVMKALDTNPVFPIRGDVSVERDFTYIGDVVDIFLRTLSWRGRNEVYNIATGETTTLETLARTVMRIASVDKPIEAGAPGAFGPKARRATAEKVKRDFGFTFTSLADGMKPTIEWYRHAYRP